MNAGQADALIIGGAIADILLCPVDAGVFSEGSHPVDSIAMDVGGDALNESTILARLGHTPRLLTKLGADGVADMILNHCAREGIDTSLVVREQGLATGINAVLVGPTGERSFVTNRNGSLRRLGFSDIEPALDALEGVRIACLASMFVSPMLGISEMEKLFAALKSKGILLCADTTKRKNGETLADVAGALRHVDYFFPNREEAALLSGLDDPEEIAEAFLAAGVEHVVIKLGADGCLIRSATARLRIPAYPDAVCLDTTGAGDNFVAAFLCALLEGKDLRGCGCFANAAASVCIERLGATKGVTDRAEVERRCARIEKLTE